MVCPMPITATWTPLLPFPPTVLLLLLKAVSYPGTLSDGSLQESHLASCPLPPSLEGRPDLQKPNPALQPTSPCSICFLSPLPSSPNTISVIALLSLLFASLHWQVRSQRAWISVCSQTDVRVHTTQDIVGTHYTFPK